MPDPTNPPTGPPFSTERPEGDALLWKHVGEALRGLQFGTVTLIVQDGLVIQVDRTEKRRLPRQDDKR
jgi:hypothetical protein